MLKYALVFVVFLFPLFVNAVGFDRDLYFGVSNDSDVTRLQEFLRSESVYDGPVTGNFFSLTLEGVKTFQKREGIEPVLGYFGKKTRARANLLLDKSEVSKKTSAIAPLRELTKEEFTSDLDAQIQALQAHILKLQEGKKETFSARSAPLQTLVFPITPPPPPPPLPKLSIFEVAGLVESPFPEIVTTPLKLGDFSLFNGTAADITFLQFVVEITDDMNSQYNRGREVFLSFRDGSSNFDPLISKTSWTTLSRDPRAEPASPNVSKIYLAFPTTLKSGEVKKASLWIENLELVLNGKFSVELKEVLATESIVTSGGFKFTLTR